MKLELNKIFKLNDTVALQNHLFQFQKQELGLKNQKCALTMGRLFHHM